MKWKRRKKKGYVNYLIVNAIVTEGVRMYACMFLLLS